MSRIKSVIENLKQKNKDFLIIFMSQAEESEDSKEQAFSNTFNLIMLLGVTLLFLAWLNYKNSTPVMHYSTMIGGIVTFIFAILGKITKSRGVMSVGVGIVCMILFTFWGMVGGNEGFALVWLTLVPFACMFTFGIRYGLYISIYFIIYLVILFYTPMRERVAVHYTDIFMERFPFLYIVATITSFFGVYSLHKANLQNEMQRKELAKYSIEADAANRAKSEFLANMSHEIRTPINVVLGMNELILRESRDNNITGYAENIETSGRLLLAIINDILDFSRVESGKMNIVTDEYYVANMITDLIIMASGRFEEKGLRFNVNVDENVPSILLGDEIRIKQIIMNLLTNAKKYTDEGSIELYVSGNLLEDCVIAIDPEENADTVVDEIADVEDSDKKIYELTISVKDTGKGIKRDDMTTLFDSFVRVERDSTRNIEGTGLGLALVKTLSEKMGGNVSVESTYGVGSTFTVKIPQEIVDITPVGDFDKSMAGSVRKPVNRETTIEAKGVRILTVDDVEANCEVVKGLLKDSGATIDIALSGEAAINLCRETKYDVIFMDHMMNGMDGIQTMNYIREVELNSDTPIIVLTANALSGMKEKYEEAGFDGFLSKPIHPEKLNNMVLESVPGKVRRKKVDAKTKNDDSVISAEDYKQIEVIESSVPGIKVLESIENYTGSLKLYLKLLDGVCKADRKDKMVEFFNTKDFQSYRVEAHTLKGMLRSVGLDNLSNELEALQKACDEENYNYVEENHERVISELSSVVDKIYEIDCL